MLSYPKGFLASLWVVLALLFMTGLVLLPGALEMRLEWDLPWRLPGGMRIAVAAAHALGAFLTLLVIGALIPLHMRQGLRRQRSVATGIWLLVILGLLAISGLAIYYVGGEFSSVLASMVHVVAGLAIIIPLTVHAVKGRRMRLQRLLEAGRANRNADLMTTAAGGRAANAQELRSCREPVPGP